jgi:purine catabolism regulator
MATLRELSELPRLGIAVLRASVEDLDREVRWAHVTELPDPSPYLREDELILTNGLWMAEGRTADDYVDAIARRGGCGLVFGLLAERRRVPPKLVQACRTRSLPLLTLPVEVPFTAVSEALAELQGTERQRELVRSVTRSDALVAALAGGAHELDVLRLLTDDHSLPVALVDHAGRVIAHEDLDPSRLDVDALVAAMNGPARAEVALIANGPAAIFPVDGLSEVEALLVCAHPLVDLTAAERSALQQTARFLTLELTRRQALAAIESRFAGELLEMILDATRRSHEVPGRLRSFALDPNGPLAVVSTAFAGPDSATVAGLDDVVARFWLRRAVPAVVPQGSDDALSVVGWPHGAEALHAAAQELADVISIEWPRRRVAVGVGRLGVDHHDLRRSLLEAREARRVAQRRRRGAAVATFDHVGSHRVLLALQSPDTLKEFGEAVLAPLREHDRVHRADLEHTLSAFLAEGGRWNATAEQLHVHVNTLRNRLRRVEELTGRDLQSTGDRVDFHLALHALDEQREAH